MNSATVLDRLLAKVAIDEHTGCWVWTASLRLGYGQIYVGTKSNGSKLISPTHRIAYELLVGAVPDGLEIDHLCRNRACCNPDHLEAVPHHINIRRAVSGSDHACKNGHTDMFYSEKDKRYYCRKCRVAAGNRFRDRNRGAVNARTRELRRQRRLNRIAP